MDTVWCEAIKAVLSQYKGHDERAKRLSGYAIGLCGYFRSLLRNRREFRYDEKESTKINLHYLRNEFYHLQMLVAKLQTAKGKDAEQIKYEHFRTSDIR